MDKVQLSPISFIEFNTHKVPEFKEDKSKDWILFGTEGEFRNRYPDYLTQLFNRSSKHNAIIIGKANYIAGNGFDIDADGLTTTSKSIILDKLRNPNNELGETIGDIGYKCALDVEVYGGCYLEIIWKKNGRDFEINHIDFPRLRLDKELDGFWYSNDWKSSTQSEEKTGLKYIPKIDLNNKKGSGIYFYYEYRPDNKHYPLPNYLGTIPYAEIDYEIANFHLANLKTGFHAGTIISFNNGKPSIEEKENVERKLKEKFTGTDRAGSLMLTWTLSKENAPTIERISPSDLDKQFEILNNTVRTELFTGHRITSPTLFGVATPGTLGQRNEMIDAYEIFKSTYVDQKQKALNKFFKPLFELMGIPCKVHLKEVAPITLQYSEQAKLQVLTKNEIREEMGYKEIEEPEPKEVSSYVHRFDNHTDCLEFSAEQIETTLAVFRKYGRKRYNYNSYARFSYQFAELLDDDMKEIYRSVLDLIEKDSFIDNKSIAEALKVPVGRVDKVLAALESAGAFDTKNVKKYGDKVERKILSEKAREIIDSNPPKQSEWELRYGYGWNPRVAKRSLKNSRDFCKYLMEEDRLYTRKEIDQISAELGYNVFERRGGWWNHGDGVLTPYCRHIWVAEYVKEV
jgi:hypothetical protein